MDKKTDSSGTTEEHGDLKMPSIVGCNASSAATGEASVSSNSDKENNAMLPCLAPVPHAAAAAPNPSLPMLLTGQRQLGAASVPIGAKSALQGRPLVAVAAQGGGLTVPMKTPVEQAPWQGQSQSNVAPQVLEEWESFLSSVQENKQSDNFFTVLGQGLMLEPRGLKFLLKKIKELAVSKRPVKIAIHVERVKGTKIVADLVVELLHLCRSTVRTVVLAHCGGVSSLCPPKYASQVFGQVLEYTKTLGADTLTKLDVHLCITNANQTTLLPSFSSLWETGGKSLKILTLHKCGLVKAHLPWVASALSNLPTLNRLDLTENQSLFGFLEREHCWYFSQADADGFTSVISNHASLQFLDIRGCSFYSLFMLPFLKRILGNKNLRELWLPSMPEACNWRAVLHSIPLDSRRILGGVGALMGGKEWKTAIVPLLRVHTKLALLGDEYDDCATPLIESGEVLTFINRNKCLEKLPEYCNAPLGLCSHLVAKLASESVENSALYEFLRRESAHLIKNGYHSPNKKRRAQPEAETRTKIRNTND